MTVRTALVLGAALTLSIVPAPAEGGEGTSSEGARRTAFSDTVLVVKADERPSAAALTSRVSEATFLSARRVVLARDDNFADALASGLMQDESPLLLVPSAGPVPRRVMAEIRRLGADTAVILGGPAAVSEAVEAELQAEGLAVARRAGSSRLETATRIAELEGSDASHALLVRGFAPNGGDASQAFADTLAAGGLSADNGWPILLTDSDSLSEATAAYLTASGIDEVTIVGGPAAVSDGVEEQVRALGKQVVRIAGATRADTAVTLAGARASSEAGFAQAGGGQGEAVLVEGFTEDAWIGGFAAAGYSAAQGAPIVLASGSSLPPETRGFLDGRAPASSTGPTLMCVVDVAVCEAGRTTMGLPALAQVTLDPPGGSTLASGQRITVRVDGGGPQDGPATVGGSCLPGPAEVQSGGAGVQVAAADPLPGGPCTVSGTVHYSNGTTQTTTVGYNGALPEANGDTVVFSEASTGDDPGAGIYRINPDGTRRELLLACERCLYPLATPDGRRLLAVRHDLTTLRFELIRVDAPGFDRATVLWDAGVNAQIRSLQVTPDARAAVVHVTASSSSGQSGIWVIPLDGTTARQLSTVTTVTLGNGLGIAPSGPGGSLEVLVNDRGVGGLINIETGANRQLPAGIEIRQNTRSLSPDGRFVRVFDTSQESPAGREGCDALLELATNEARCLMNAVTSGQTSFGGFTPGGGGFYSISTSGEDLVIGSAATASITGEDLANPFVPGLCREVTCVNLQPSPDLTAFTSSGINLITLDPIIVRSISPGTDRSFSTPVWLRGVG